MSYDKDYLIFFKRPISCCILILTVVLVISMIRQFAAIRPLAGKLQLPYLYWLLFAAYLNLGVWYLNR